MEYPVAISAVQRQCNCSMRSQLHRYALRGLVCNTGFDLLD